MGVGRSMVFSLTKAGASYIAIASLGSFDGLQADIDAIAKSAGKATPQTLFFELDITDQVAVEKAAELVRSTFGRLDIVLNNAAYVTPSQPMLTSDVDPWWRTFEVGLKGVYFIDRFFVPLLLSTPDGLKTIVNTTSIASQNIRPMASSYGIMKFAGLRLQEFLMLENAEAGLLAFSIHPGWYLTQTARDVMPEYMFPLLDNDLALVGDSVAWLTEERREWLGGRYVSCNWDMEELVGRRDEIVSGDMLKMRLVV